MQFAQADSIMCRNERENSSFSECLAAHNSETMAPTHSSIVTNSISPDSGPESPLTSSNNTSSSDLKATSQYSSQSLETTASTKPGSDTLPSTEVSGRQQEGAEVVVLQSGNRTSTNPSSSSSGMPSIKISPPKQETARMRILSPLVTHSHRLSVMPTTPSNHSKEEGYSFSKEPKKQKQTVAGADTPDVLLTSAPSQMPLTSFQSPFLYTAVPNPWTPSMDWQLPSIVSMIMASSPSPSPYGQWQLENEHPESGMPELPKWMWADLFGGLSSSSASATLLSSIFSPQQWLTWSMSPFSPSQLLNLPMPKVDAFPVVAPTVAYSPGRWCRRQFGGEPIQRHMHAEER